MRCAQTCQQKILQNYLHCVILLNSHSPTQFPYRSHVMLWLWMVSRMLLLGMKCMFNMSRSTHIIHHGAVLHNVWRWGCFERSAPKVALCKCYPQQQIVPKHITFSWHSGSLGSTQWVYCPCRLQITWALKNAKMILPDVISKIRF